MTRRLFPLLLLASALLLPGCATNEARSNPGVRLRRSDALYAGETYGDSARRRKPTESGRFRIFGKTFRDPFISEPPGGF